MRFLVMKWTFLSSCIIAGVLNASWLFADEDHHLAEIRCLDCHVTLPFEGVPLLFHTDTSAICLNCHTTFQCKSKLQEKSFSHPVDVFPSIKIPADMPLDAKKGMGCITCHFYHDGPYGPDVSYEHLLRRPVGEKFCTTCHDKKLKR